LYMFISKQYALNCGTSLQHRDVYIPIKSTFAN